MSSSANNRIIPCLNCSEDYSDPIRDYVMSQFPAPSTFPFSVFSTKASYKLIMS